MAKRGTKDILSPDITERKWVEEELRESEEKYRHLFNNLNDAAFLADVETGIIIDTNQQGTTLLGRSRDEIVGMHQSELHPLGKADEYRQRFSTHIRKGHAGDFDGEVIRKNGGIVPVAISASLLTIGGQFLILGLFRDITERKQAEEVLRQSEENLKTYLESAPDGVYLNDLKGTFLYGNKKAEKLTGYKREELVGKSFLKLNLLPKKHLAKAGKLLVLNVMGRPTGPDEFELIRKDGSHIWVEITTTPIEQEGKVVVIGFVRDVTERKWAEQEIQAKNEQLNAQNEELQSQSEELITQQQELMEKTRELEAVSRAKSEFLSSMSHELRTPLNSVIGFSELMLDGIPGEINDEQKQCLSDIWNSGQHLLNLINAVLDLSKVEAGKMKLKLENLSLADTIEDIARTVKPMLDENRHKLAVSMEEGLPQVRADKSRLRQIFLNLLSNAIKFTPPGGKLAIDTSREGDWCQVSVIDSGIGIKKDDQEHIFEAFTQAEALPDRQKEGTGLGLALTKQFVEAIGGRIWLESQYGKGSKFTFTLPLAREGEPYLEKEAGKSGRLG